MSEHTKGPWKLYDVGDVQSVHYGRKELGGSNTVVNWPGFDSSGVPMKQRKANARLIAAAPELLEACIEFVRKCDAGEARSKRSYQQMKAAIDKATAHPSRSGGGG